MSALILFFCFRDQSERTPLHLAAIKGSLPCCEVLINRNEDCINDLDKNKVHKFERSSLNIVILLIVTGNFGALVWFRKVYERVLTNCQENLIKCRGITWPARDWHPIKWKYPQGGTQVYKRRGYAKPFLGFEIL